ncbi:flagellar filament capping protein FliD [Clostridium tyrobutyricum]|uniref:flagellar filament capping protein FliD n=1 Tax=Clostridium tyrobutyricum TaxID=1519 RepID=UPI0018A12530|nr:flagellar filament capping protein FliD [Clostridium tyrobutyricum]
MASYDNNITRMTGLVTGLDVDSIVKNLIKAEQAKVDKAKQQKQVLQWQQDMYRDLIGNVNTMKSTYFDPLKGDTYMLSSKNLLGLDVSGSPDTSGLTVSGGSGAVSGNYTVKVNNLAQKATIRGTSNISVTNLGKSVYGIKIDDSNNKITINGTEITLDTDTKYNSINDLANSVNSKIQANDTLKDKVRASVNSDGKIDFENLIKIDDTNKDITVNYGGHNYKVTMSAGNYTKDTLAAAVSSALNGKASEDDPSVKFTSDVTLTANSDFSGFSVVDKDKNVLGSASIKAGDTSIIPTVVDLSGTTGTIDDSSRSTAKVEGNLLSYDNKIITGFNDSFNVKINGTATPVKLGEGVVNSLDDLKEKINSALTVSGISTADLEAQLSTDGSTLQFKSASSNQVVVTAGSTGSASGVIGTSSYMEVTTAASQKMSDLVNGAVSFSINGVDFNYDFSDSGDEKNKTIQDIMSDISTKANVNISYSQLTKSFTMTSKTEGSDQKLNVSDTSGSFISTLLGSSTPASQDGKDASVTITAPGQSEVTVTKPSNNFTIDGVSYQLNSNTVTGTDIKFSLNGNTDNIIENIKGFVDKYNSMITAFNAKLSEKKDYNYQPLTDAQKEDMNDTDIENWETKAKQGLLKNDSELSNFLEQLRQSIYTTVQGAGISMSDIGITTSSDWTQNGTLVIDEDKLKNAIQNNGDKVALLFTKQTSSENKYYRPDLTSSQRSERYSDEGVFQRINDIFQDYTRTTRDSNGRKGIFLEEAGISGDLSDTTSILSKQIQQKDDEITNLLDAMNDKENSYYEKYSQLEQTIANLQAQQEQLMAQLGQSS